MKKTMNNRISNGNHCVSSWPHQYLFRRSSFGKRTGPPLPFVLAAMIHLLCCSERWFCGMGSSMFACARVCVCVCVSVALGRNGRGACEIHPSAVCCSDEFWFSFQTNPIPFGCRWGILIIEFFFFRHSFRWLVAFPFSIESITFIEGSLPCGFN